MMHKSLVLRKFFQFNLTTPVQFPSQEVAIRSLNILEDQSAHTKEHDGTWDIEADEVTLEDWMSLSFVSPGGVTGRMVVTTAGTAHIALDEVRNRPDAAATLLSTLIDAWECAGLTVTEVPTPPVLRMHPLSDCPDDPLYRVYLAYAYPRI